MTQAELDYAIAKATGESTKTIADLGFVPLTPIPFEREPDRKPLTVDWDDVARSRYESI